MSVIRRLIVIAIVVVMIFSGFPSKSGSAQEPKEIGSPHNGQNGLELIGQADQSDFNLHFYGYVTHIHGLAPELLFAEGTDPVNRGETTARITFSGTGTIYARSVRQPIFLTSATIDLVFYYNETPVGANFDDPATFASGTPIFTLTTRLQTILNVQAPDVAVFMSNGEASQSATASFTLNGEAYQFGHDGLVHKLDAFGQGLRASITPLAVQLFFAANTVAMGDLEE